MWKRWVLAALGALALMGAAYAAGRFTAPEKVVTREHETVRTVMQEDTQAREQVRQLTAQLETFKRDSHRIETIQTHHDGTRTVRIETDSHVDREKDSRSATAVEADSHSTRQVETVREVVRERIEEHSRPAWRLTPMGGIDFPAVFHGQLRFVYGGMLERRILGPISIGGWGLSSGLGGVSLSLEF